MNNYFPEKKSFRYRQVYFKSLKKNFGIHKSVKKWFQGSQSSKECLMWKEIQRGSQFQLWRKQWGWLARKNKCRHYYQLLGQDVHNVVKINYLCFIDVDNMLIILSSLLNMKTKTLRSLYKNLICASVALLLLFFTSIFVIKAIFQKEIDHLIDQATILTEYSFTHSAQSTLTGDNSQEQSMELTPIPLLSTTIQMYNIFQFRTSQHHSLLSYLTTNSTTTTSVLDKETKVQFNMYMNGKELCFKINQNYCNNQ